MKKEKNNSEIEEKILEEIQSELEAVTITEELPKKEEKTKYEFIKSKSKSSPKFSFFIKS